MPIGGSQKIASRNVKSDPFPHQERRASAPDERRITSRPTRRAAYPNEVVSGQLRSLIICQDDRCPLWSHLLIQPSFVGALDERQLDEPASFRGGASAARILTARITSSGQIERRLHETTIYQQPGFCMLVVLALSRF
jgi:hypothetical protein